MFLCCITIVSYRPSDVAVKMHESTVQVPVNAVTLSQFLSLRPHHNPSQVQMTKHANTISKRSKSLEDVHKVDSFASDAMKGNSKGTIQGPFTTLENALKVRDEVAYRT